MRPRALLPVAAALCLLLSASTALAHPADPHSDAWSPLLEDCGQEGWGNHQTNEHNRTGHDLLRLDLQEGTIPDGGPGIGFRLTMDMGYDQEGILRDNLTFDVQDAAGAHLRTVNVTLETDDNENYTTPAPGAEHEQAVDVSKAQKEGTHFYVDLWFTYDQLGTSQIPLQDGFNLTNLTVEGSIGPQDRDVMVGGYESEDLVTADPCSLNPGQDHGPYTIEDAPGLPPSPSFTVDTSDPVTGDVVSFTDTSTDPEGDIEAWSWDFGDGNTSTEQNPSHTYGEPDTYEVTLTVTDAGGNEVESSPTSLTIGNAAPEVSFTFDPSDPTAGETVTFSTQVTDPEGDDVLFDWDFGDGSNGTGANPAHVYAEAGDYTVTLNVTDTEGNTAQATRTVSVVASDTTSDQEDDQSDGDADDGNATTGPAENRPPEAELALSPNQPGAGQAVTFQDRSTDPDGQIVERVWRFGDTVTSNVTNPTHVYAEPGEYTVTLTVTDDQGATDNTTLTLTVLEASEVDTGQSQDDQGIEDEVLNQTAADANATGNSTDNASEEATGVPGPGLVALVVSLGAVAAWRRD